MYSKLTVTYLILFSLDISTNRPLASSSDDNDNNDGSVIALSILFALAVIGLVASILINVFLTIKLKRSKCTVEVATTNQSCKELNGNQPTDTKCS